MKKLLTVLLLTIASTNPAMADGAYGHGGGHGVSGHGGGGEHGGGGGAWWIIPALIGGTLIYELSQPQPAYSQPATIYVEPQPQIYGPRTTYAPEVPSSVAQSWYYCASSNAYYPYVRSCPDGWQAVPTTPPTASSSSPPPPPQPR